MTAIITGADGGMGFVITRSFARAGFEVSMACLDPRYGEKQEMNQLKL